MAAIMTESRTFLSNIVRLCARMIRGEDSEDRHAALIAELLTAQLVPAVVVPGIEHQAAATIVRTSLPTVTYQRRTITQRLDEHVFLDVDAGIGVRVMASWDDRAHRVRMHVAETGEHGLWDRIVSLFTAWEITGRPVPPTTASAATS